MSYSKALLLVALLLGVSSIYAQKSTDTLDDSKGKFSLGVRSTLSYFDHDGVGLGTGGQFRIQLSNRVNTDWFADYIVVNSDDKIRSTYYHIGWSVVFYPIEEKKTIQPYIMVGHCFDYNEKTDIKHPWNTKNRWGSAIQSGIGAHFWLTDKFDISLTTQYMIHLTKEIEAHYGVNDEVIIERSKHNTLESHILTTVSLNYTLGKLWGK